MNSPAWLKSLSCQHAHAMSGRRRSRRYSTSNPPALTESLETRSLLTATPVLAPLADVTLLSGSPLHIPLNGSDADGQALTFSASSSSSDVSTYIPEGNRSLEIDVQNFGVMRFELFEDKAPRATEQIIELAESGFYDGSTFHRVIDNFVLQGGDPHGEPPGTGGSSLGEFDDQFHPDLQHNQTGVLSMARSLDDTNDSQFFITEGAQRHLDSQHTVFGLLTGGEAVREAISGVAVTNSVPDTPVVISSFSVFTDVENGVLMLSAPEGVTGTATVIVTVSDPDGNQSQQSFDVTIQSDSVNNQPFLADIPAVRTLVDTPTELQLTRIDLEGHTATFLDEVLLGINNLFVPEYAHTDLEYFIDSSTGATTISPGNGLTGTHNITAAVGEFPSAIDYQVVPIEIVSVAGTWTVSTDDHPNGNEANDGAADTFRIVRSDSRFEIYINDVLSAQAEDVSVTEIVINGSDDDDILILDGSGGDPAPAEGITFNAAGQASIAGDQIEILSRPVASVIHSASQTIPGDGTVNIDEVMSYYSGVESITDRLTAVDRTFNRTDASEQTIVGDDGVSANGLSRIWGGAIAAAIDFADPTGTLTVNALDGDDEVTIQELDGGATGVIVNGGDGADTLFGGAGDDRLDGGQDSDLILGNAGNDTALGSDGEDTVLGNGGDDSLSGGAHDDVVNGGGGDDTLTGEAGNDNLAGGSGRDSLDAGDGNDRLFGQGATGDTLRGGAGDDLLDGGAGDDVLAEEADADFVLTNSVMTGRGNDTVVSVERAILFGGASNNRIDTSAFFTAGKTSVTLRGLSGDDTLIGSDINDALLGDAGNDTLEGRAGNDNLSGAAGRDLLIGGEGNDRLRGQGASFDTLVGGHGDDTLDGGAGTDVVMETGDVDFTLTSSSMTGHGNDTVVNVECAILVGGAGDNVIDISGFAASYPPTLDGGGGNDLLIGSSFMDLLRGQGGNDTLHGGAGNDFLQGGEGHDQLVGGSGTDGLSGGSGDDSVFGGLGDDTAFGGSGDDSIRGESGADTLFGGADSDDVDGGADTDQVAGGSGDGAADSGDVVTGLAEEIDEAFQFPVPNWVRES